MPELGQHLRSQTAHRFAHGSTKTISSRCKPSLGLRFKFEFDFIIDYLKSYILAELRCEVIYCYLFLNVFHSF